MFYAHPRISSYGYTEKGAAKYHRLNCGRYFNDLTSSVLGARDCGEDRRGLRRRGRGTYDGDKPPVQTFTERRGETGFFVKRNLSRADTKKTLKTVAEGEIRVNTDEYSVYEGVIEVKT